MYSEAQGNDGACYKRSTRSNHGSVSGEAFKALAYGIHGFGSDEADSGDHGLRVPRMQVGKLSSEQAKGVSLRTRIWIWGFSLWG
jgi:hypothetical protein